MAPSREVLNFLTCSRLSNSRGQTKKRASPSPTIRNGGLEQARNSPVATTKNREDLTFTANKKILIDTIKRQLAVAGAVLNLNCFVSLSTIQNLRKVL